MSIDRILAIVGIVLAVLFWVQPIIAPTFPRWIAYTVLGIAIFALGTSLGFYLGGRKSPVDTAMLRLHVYADARTPERIADENIFRWYLLRGGARFIDAQGTSEYSAYLSTLFVTFEPDVKITTLHVQSPDMALPPFEVKDFNQRFAIIAFGGLLGNGTLEITVHP